MHAYTLFFIVERKKKKKRQSGHLWFLSCQHFVVWRHWRGDMMPYFHTVDLGGLLESMCKGFLLHHRLLWSYYTYLLCYIHFVWFVKMYRTLSVVKKSDANWFTFSCQLRPITVSCCISLLIAAFLWCEMEQVSFCFFRLTATLILWSCNA